MFDKSDTRVMKQSKYSLTTHRSLLHLPCAMKKENSIDGERRFAVKLRVASLPGRPERVGPAAARLHRERRSRVARKRKGGQAGTGVYIQGIGCCREFRRDGVSAESSRGQHLRAAVHPRYR